MRDTNRPLARSHAQAMKQVLLLRRTLDCTKLHDAFGASSRYTVMRSAARSEGLLCCKVASIRVLLRSASAALCLVVRLRPASTSGNSLCCCSSSKSCTHTAEIDVLLGLQTRNPGMEDCVMLIWRGGWRSHCR